MLAPCALLALLVGMASTPVNSSKTLSLERTSQTLSLARPTSTHPASSCNAQCGYSKLGAHLPQLFSIDFTKTNTPALISAAGLYITSTFDYQIGATAEDGTTAYGQASNIRPASNPKDGIDLVVPGGQKGKKKVTGAEMTFQGAGEGMTRMFAEIEMKIDPTPGTCQTMVRGYFAAPSIVKLTQRLQFTYVNDYEHYSDEMDIEILSSSIMHASDVADAGVQLTNYAHDQSGANQAEILPFPTDPTKSFNKFRCIGSRNFRMTRS